VLLHVLPYRYVAWLCWAGQATAPEALINVVTTGGSVTSLFSMLAILTGQAAPALMVTAVAAEESEVVRLPLETLQQLAERFPAAGVQMVQVRLYAYTHAHIHTHTAARPPRP
jgi:hypothetical protein